MKTETHRPACIDYSMMFTPEVMRHLRHSVLAAQAEGNDYTRIEADRIVADFGDMLTPQQYRNCDFDQAETILFDKLAQIEEQMGFPVKTDDAHTVTGVES